MSEELPLQNVRELLQYVPQFSGKVFAVELPWSLFSDSQKSEAMLDLASLHSVGIKIAIAVPETEISDILDWAIDFDLCLENDMQHSGEAAVEVMNRGQVVLLPSSSDGYLSSSLVDVLSEIKPDKVISLIACEIRSKLGEGVSISEEQWVNDQEKEWGFHSSVKTLLTAGVNRVHLLDALQPSVLLVELFSNEGCGMMIYRDSYRVIRKMCREDIPEVLVMISRSVRNFTLVPREYEDLEVKLDDYYVYQIDENVVGCVALHHYQNDWAEVACLYVKKGHQQRGYGVNLVQHVEQCAEELKVKKLFALTTSSADFFTQSLGYKKFELSQVPEVRAEQVKLSGRSSMAFYKDI